MLQLFGNRVSSQLLENMELICGIERVGSRFRDHFVCPEKMVTHLLSLVVVEIFIVNTRQGSFERKRPDGSSFPAIVIFEGWTSQVAVNAQVAGGDVKGKKTCLDRLQGQAACMVGFAK